MGNLEKGSEIAFVVFDDSTGIIVARMDGNWDGAVEDDITVKKTLTVEKEITGRQTVQVNGNLTVRENIKLGGKFI